MEIDWWYELKVYDLLEVICSCVKFKLKGIWVISIFGLLKFFYVVLDVDVF